MSALNQKMDEVVEYLGNELAQLRTGRANPALVTDLKIDVYGASTPLQQVAQVSVPDATNIVITPWDKGNLPAIEEAIKKADLGINPVNDGNTIRLTLPPMTEERRSDMTKVVGEKLEAARVSLRNIRHEAITSAEKEDLPEDALKREKDEITKLTNDYAAKLEQMAEDKKQEIMTL